MMSSQTLLLSTRLRQLMPSHLTKLSMMLDPDDSWKDLVSTITNRYGEPMFSVDQVANIEYHKAHKSPTKEVIMTWNTDNPTVADLMDALKAIGHYRAADYINIEILKRSDPVERNVRNLKADHIRQQNGNINASRNGNPQNAYVQQGNTQVPSKHAPPKVDLESAMRMQTVSDNIDVTLTHPSVSQSDNTMVKFPISIDDSRSPEDHVSSASECTSLNDMPTSPIEDISLPALSNIKGVQKFSSDFLAKITGNFSSLPLEKGGHFLGEGGFAKVYKGIHEEHPTMAVKRINTDVLTDLSSITKNQFSNELETLAKCCHDNILRLVGYCDDMDWCLVYEYMPNGNLEDKLASKTSPLSIPTRLSILQGIARGLCYLHHLDPPLVHRDIKSANILLARDLSPKIGDCGTVRRGPTNKSVTCTQLILGTQAYMPQEYLQNGEVSPKLDAFSYGVILLEMITGLPVYDEHREERLLPTHISETVDDDKDILDLTDKRCGQWSSQLVLDMYKTSEQLRAHKRRRVTVSEKLSEIESWTGTRGESKC